MNIVDAGILCERIRVSSGGLLEVGDVVAPELDGDGVAEMFELSLEGDFFDARNGTRQVPPAIGDFGCGAALKLIRAR